jgi:hypothetical protein
VLVVWEPILATDWKSPSGSTLGRISDGRAKQFWDSKHLVSAELNRIASQKTGQPEPECCVQKGFQWDEPILYAPHLRWQDNPTPMIWDGPVVRIISTVEKALSELR